MIATIARKEAREMIRDGRLRVAAVLVLMLLIAAMLSGWARYQRLTTQREAASAMERTIWTTQKDKNPHSAAHYGSWAFKPLTPLAMLDYGVTPYTGTALFMEGHAVRDATYRPVDDATGTARLGELTAAVALQWLVPLLIIVFAYGAFAREREQGTLLQLMSVGVSPRALAVGKSLGLTAPLLALLIPASLLGSVALLLGPSAAWNAWSWPRVLMLAGVYLAYFTLFIGLTLLVSALAQSARTALLILITFWFGNAFVAPRLASDVAETMRPGLDAAAFAKEMAHVDESMEPWEERGKSLTKRLMKEHRVDSPDELPINVAGLNLLESEAEGTDGYRAIHKRIADDFQGQNAIVQAGGVLAPLLAVQSLSMALAGTDYAHHRHFAQFAEAYRLDIVQTLNRDVMLNARPGDQWDGDYTVGGAFWESIPAFAYTPPDVGWALGGQWVALIVLLLWVGSLALVAPRVIRRMKVIAP